MNKPKFTPGPWKIDARVMLHTFGEDNLRGERVGQSFELCDFLIQGNISGHSLPIASVKRECGFSDVKGKVHQFPLPISANAYLIAAAPEMYAMLERCAEAFGTMGASYRDAEAEIDALLAKARGEAKEGE